MLSFALVSLNASLGVGDRGAHLLCEPREGGFEREDRHWSAVLALGGPGMWRVTSGECIWTGQ